MNYLIDSNIIIGYLKRAFPRDITKFLSHLNVERNAIFCTCDIVLAEVRGGLAEGEFAEVKAFLMDLKYFPSNQHVALLAGRFFYTLSARGERIPLADCLIASTAHWFDATIVTGDKNHFQRLEAYIYLFCICDMTAVCFPTGRLLQNVER